MQVKNNCGGCATFKALLENKSERECLDRKLPLVDYRIDSDAEKATFTGEINALRRLRVYLKLKS